jgi:hypothetical protein
MYSSRNENYGRADTGVSLDQQSLSKLVQQRLQQQQQLGQMYSVQEAHSEASSRRESVGGPLPHMASTFASTQPACSFSATPTKSGPMFAAATVASPSRFDQSSNLHLATSPGSISQHSQSQTQGADQSPRAAALHVLHARWSQLSSGMKGARRANELYVAYVCTRSAAGYYVQPCLCASKLHGIQP